MGDRESTAAFGRLREASRRGDTDVLRRGLLDPEWRWAAAGFLADNDAREALPEIARLLDASDEGARRGAIQAIGRLAGRKYVARIRELADCDPSHMNRLWAIAALGQIGGPGEREYLVGLLDDPRFDVRRAAVWGLGQLRDPAALESVRRARRSEVRRNPVRYWLLGRSAYTTAMRILRDAASRR